ncbi:A24 family peptidase [Nocardioides terrisoli]|uniref:A24 family peptidase n=1 Tax=Nocardioides terrisoli TaxID=3388267 RepID=UPI00287B6B64|nr:A24 family peptidase [Nocardioides marmorisolisilvae]
MGLELGLDALRSAVVLGAAGVAAGLLGPTWMARIPEPAADPATDPAESIDLARPAPTEPTASADREPEVPKELYRDIAVLPGLRVGLALVTGAVAAVVGARIGWGGALLPWAFLLAVAVPLAVVDWRTRLLPTYVIAPSYGVLVLLTLAAAAVDRDAHALLGALLGWVALGGFYVLIWVVYPRGMGYGDVRLSGLLGIALGYLGWPEVLTGGYAGLLLGSLLGFALARAGLVDRRHVPFGPFMVLGAAVGAVFGPLLAHSLGY